MTTVVVLNGTSSSGKTTLARAVQKLAPRVFLNFSIDSILSTLPESAIERIVAGADISDLNYPKLVHAYYACVRQLLELGHDLIIDNAVTVPYHVEHLEAAIAGNRAILIGLHCPPEVLAERERIRGDRRLGLAALQHPRIHSLLRYDLEIDTSRTSADDAARDVLRLLP